MQLAPTDPIARYEWLKKHVKGESLDERGADSGAALADELRELDAAVGNVKDKKNLTPEERARLESLETKSEGALAVYAQWSAEMEAIAIQALSMAAGLLVTVVTGGAGAVVAGEMLSMQFAAQVARAALANAIANVAVQASVKGGRLDMQGAEAAFFTGAVTGAANVLAAPVAGSLSKAYASAMKTAAADTAKSGFASVAPGFVKSISEGALSSGAAAGVEAAASKDTWKYGFVAGVKGVATQMFEATAIGAATGAVAHGAIEFTKAQLFPGAGTPPAGGAPPIAPAAAVDQVAAQRNALGILRAGSAPWQHWVALATEMGEHAAAYREAFLKARRQLAAEVCISLEPSLERAGLTWELHGGVDLSEPLEIRLKPRGEAGAKGVSGEPQTAAIEDAADDVHKKLGARESTAGVEVVEGKSPALGAKEIDIPVTIGEDAHRLQVRRVGEKVEVWLCTHCGTLIDKIDQVLGEIADPTGHAKSLVTRLTRLRERAVELEANITTGKVPLHIDTAKGPQPHALGEMNQLAAHLRDLATQFPEDAEVLKYFAGFKATRALLDYDLLAEHIGFQRTNARSHGQPVYQNGANDFITPDVDAHLGATWKRATSVENLKRKTTRMGSYSQDLKTRLGD
jgi:hypothetical protein